jgi:hypothetical protein
MGHSRTSCPDFRTIQVCPKDRLTLSLAGSKMRQNRLRPAAPSWYDRRGGIGEEAPMSGMGRREFVSLLGSAAATWPVPNRHGAPGGHESSAGHIASHVFSVVSRNALDTFGQ